MEKPIKLFIIANGGYLTEPIVEELSLSPEDDEYDIDEFDSFTDYVEYIVEESKSAYEQKFASTVVLTEKQFNLLQTYGK
jgi:hypothetical protein